MTLYQALTEHFNKAAEDFPVAKELFAEKLERVRAELLKSHNRGGLSNRFSQEVFPMKGICYRVNQIERSFEEGEGIVRRFWGAYDIVKKHQGPLI